MSEPSKAAMTDNPAILAASEIVEYGTHPHGRDATLASAYSRIIDKHMAAERADNAKLRAQLVDVRMAHECCDPPNCRVCDALLDGENDE